MASINIVNVNVSQQVASAPSTLQSTGAFISLGGTTLSTNATKLLTQLSDLTGILGSSGNHAELLAMGTTFFAQGNTQSVYVLELGANGTPADLQTWITNNPGVFYAYLTPATWDSEATVSPPAAPTLASSTSGGLLAAGTYYVTVTYTTATGETTASGEASVTTTGSTGEITVTSPATATGATGYNVYASTSSGTELKQNGGSPITIGTNFTLSTLATGTATPPTINTTGFVGILTAYDGLSAKVYFFVTTTLSTYSQYVSTLKDVFWLIDSTNAPTTEFSCAAPFYKFLNYAPSAINRMTQMDYSYMYGVTAYPVTGNQATLDTILTDNGSFIGTGAQGGISNTIIFGGTTADGNDASYWYDADWVNINMTQALAAAVINGSNNPQAPLYYNQSGINQLAAVAQGVANSALAFGVAQSITVTAIPFSTYVTQNPNDYAKGIYNGIGVTVTPQNGFKSITFNLTISNIAVA